MTFDDATVDTLQDVLAAIEAEQPPVLELAEQFAAATATDPDSAYATITDAVEASVLVEEGNGWAGVRLADEYREEPEPPGTGHRDTQEAEGHTDEPYDEPVETTIAGGDRWADIDFATIDPQTWPPAQTEHDAWMCRTDTKAPYAPWTDPDAPVECSHGDHDEPTTCDACDHHAGYKWGSEGSHEHVHADYATAREWSDKVPSLSSDLAFIQREADPFAFVDGDDVRDPETGEVHPAFRALLEHIGLDLRRHIDVRHRRSRVLPRRAPERTPRGQMAARHRAVWLERRHAGD